jgi:predicted lipoprotein with Yx(FWY)xxD motif
MRNSFILAIAAVTAAVTVAFAQMAPTKTGDSAKGKVLTNDKAYKGRPLYTWKNDKKPGDITGDGFLNGAWHIAQP